MVRMVQPTRTTTKCVRLGYVHAPPSPHRPSLIPPAEPRKTSGEDTPICMLTYKYWNHQQTLQERLGAMH
ncbi:hypothetical protein B7P43_G12384 [Cryptotermes secundus]|uniref:Uncharacterized protein n=1 Tax=Cryptotermes secundus TaxID=105785 RepID=A0A2J7RBK7_9NEOP|nr:hypothetical protein B7P43_G12384 [Cryptotermes secundus]